VPRHASTISAIAIAAALGAAGAARVTRLDGSRIAASEIDNTVSHLIDAVRPGVLQGARRRLAALHVHVRRAGHRDRHHDEQLEREGIFKALLETLARNTFTPIEWEGFTPYDRPPGPKK
jgi:hypothetical protein